LPPLFPECVSADLQQMLVSCLASGQRKWSGILY
jgi:hypothetical protein